MRFMALGKQSQSINRIKDRAVKSRKQFLSVKDTTIPFVEFVRRYSSETKARQCLVRMRWGNRVTCPHCGRDCLREVTRPADEVALRHLQGHRLAEGDLVRPACGRDRRDAEDGVVHAPEGPPVVRTDLRRRDAQGDRRGGRGLLRRQGEVQARVEEAPPRTRRGREGRRPRREGARRKNIREGDSRHRCWHGPRDAFRHGLRGLRPHDRRVQEL